jgi:hypothetical protein
MQVYQWLAAGRWFSPGTPVSSTNKTNDIQNTAQKHKDWATRNTLTKALRTTTVLIVFPN